jgi:hypothetical protein
MAYLKSLIATLFILCCLLEWTAADYGRFGKRARSKETRALEELRRQRDDMLKAREDSKSSFRFYSDDTKRKCDYRQYSLAKGYNI